MALRCYTCRPYNTTAVITCFFRIPSWLKICSIALSPSRGKAQLDFNTLQRVNTKLHAEGLERRDGDLIYRVLYRDGAEVYLYLLLEFQSQADPWMAIRALVYVGLLYQHLIRENRLAPNGKLPPFFPLWCNR